MTTTGSCAPGSWTGATSTDWNTGSNWCTGSVPDATTNVTILASTPYPPAIAAGTPALCNSLTINTGANLAFSGTNSLTVSGNWTNNNGTAGFTAGTGTVIFNGAAQTISTTGTGSTTFNNLTLTGTGLVTLTTAVTGVNGTLSMGGTATVSAQPTYGAAATLQYNGSGAQTTGPEFPATWSGTGGVVIANTSLSAVTLGGAKIINAPLTINANAILNTSATNYAITFGGNFVNNGTITANASPVTISGTGTQSIAGFSTTGVVSMTKTGAIATLTGPVSGGGLTINGNGGTLNLGAGWIHTFSGTWTRTAGTLDGASSTLNFTVAPTVVSGSGGTFTPSTGTVGYTALAAQTIAGVTYNNLTLSGSGAKTTTGATVNGILSMEGSATSTGSIPTYGGAATLQYNGSGAQTTGSEFPATWSGTGGVIIANTSGTVSLGAAKTINSTLTINSSAVLNTTSANNYGLTFGGNFINNGTFTANASPITIGGAGSQTIAGFTTTGLVSMTKTGGTAVLAGNIGGAGFTLNGSGGTLDLGTGLVHTFTGAWTRTAGTLLGNTSTLNIGGTTTNTAGTFTPGKSTVNFNGAAQTIGNIPYYNLVLSGSGTKTFPAAITSTYLNINNSPGGALADLQTFNHSADSLYFNSALQVLGSWGSTASAAGNTNNTYFLSPSTGILYVSTTIPGTWIGGSTANAPKSLTDWNDPANWSGDVVPLPTTNVSIASTAVNQPVIYADGIPKTCNNITIGTGASLSFDATGTNSLNAGGTFTNNGTFKANSGTLTITGNLINTVTFTGNTGTFTVGGNLTNTGTFNPNSSIITIGGNLTNTGGTFTASTGSVILNGGAVSVTPGLTFNNLTLSGTGSVTFSSVTTVNGIFSIENGSNINTFTGGINYGANATLQYNAGSSSRTVSAEWPSTFTATGGVIIKGTTPGTITLNGAKQIGNGSVAAALNINSGGTLATANFGLTFFGNFVNGGNFTGGSSPITISGPVAQNIGTFSTSGASAVVLMNKTGGTALFTGNITAGGLTINGTGGGALDLNSGTHTFTGDITLTSGSLLGNLSTLNVNSSTPTAWNGTALVFTPGSGTVIFGGGVQTVATTETHFYNLKLNGSSTITFINPTNVADTLYMNGTSVASLPNLTNSLTTALVLHGVVKASGQSYGSSGSAATNKDDTDFDPASSGILNVGTCNPGAWLGLTSDWSSSSNWCGGLPGPSTDVVISAGAGIIQPVISGSIAAAVCHNITISSGASLTFSGINTLTVGGKWINNGGASGFSDTFGTIILNGSAPQISGSTTFNNLTLSSSGAVTFGSVGTDVTTVNGTLSINNGGNVNVFTGTLVYGGSAYGLQYNQGTFARTASGEWPATFAGSGGITVNGSGMITVNGNKLLGTGSDLTLASGANLNMSAYSLTLNGNLNSANAVTSGSGGLTVSGAASQNIGPFTTTGPVLMSKSGGAATLTGNLNGGTLTLNGTGGTLNLDGGVTGLTHTFSGAVTLTSGTLNGGLSTLNINATGTAWSGTGTNFGAGTGTVIFGGNGAQTLAASSTFYNLTLAGAGTKTFTGIPTINNILSLEGTASASGAPVYGSGATLQYNKPAAFTSGPEWIPTFIATGGVLIKNTGVITLNGARQLGNNNNAPLNINSGSSLTTGNFALTFHGDFINGGTLSAGSSPVTVAGTTANQNIGGFTTTGLVSMTKTAGTAIFTGGVNGSGLTINGSGTGTLDLGAGPNTFTGNLIISGGTLLGNSGNLNIGGNSTISGGGAFNGQTGTVTYNSLSASQSLAGMPYNNLVFTGSGSRLFTAATTIGGNLSTVTGPVMNLGPYNHTALSYTLNGNIQASATTPPPNSYGGTGSTAAQIVPANFASATGILYVGGQCIAGTWLGGTTGTPAVDSDWNVPANWSCGTLPTVSTDVVINSTATTQPVINGDAIQKYCNTITVNSGATLTFAGVNTLNVGTSWTNNNGASGLSDPGGTGTVNLSGAAGQIGGSTTFNNLTLSGSGVVTFGSTGADVITVNGILSVGNGSNVNIFTGALAYGPNGSLQYNAGAMPRTVSSEWPSTFNATGGITIGGSGPITLNEAKVLTDNVPLTVNSSAVLTQGANLLTLGGNLTVAGTLTSGTGGITLAGAVNQSISGFTTSGTVSMTKSNGVATFTGAVTGVGLTINGTGGTLSLGSGLSHTFSGTWTNTAGTLDGGTATSLNLTAPGVVVAGTTGIFNPNSGTVVYPLAGAQTVGGLNYTNLTLSGAGVKTMLAGTTSVTGNLTLTSGATSTATAAGLTIGGNLSIGNSSTFTLGGFPLLVTGTTTVGGGTSGTLVINNAAAAPVFTGLVTVTGGAAWNNSGNSPVNFQNGITLLGTGSFNAGTGVQTFDTNNQVLTGTYTIPSVAVNGITLTNGLTLTIGANLTGTGTLLQAGGSTLSLNFAAPVPSPVATIDAATNNNIVIYALAGAQSVYPTTYQNLTLSGSGVKSFTAGESILKTLTISSGASADLSSFTHSSLSLILGTLPQAANSYGGTASLSAVIKNSTFFGTTATGVLNVNNTSCLGGTWLGSTSTDWNTGLNWCSGIVPTASTNVIIPSVGITNFPFIGAAAFCDSLTILSGATVTMSGTNTLTVNGQWSNQAGTGGLIPGTGTVIFGGAAQTIVGATNFNNVTFGGTGLKTITTANFTVNGILSMEGDNSLAISGAPTYGTNATLQYNSASPLAAGAEWLPLVAGTGGVHIMNTGIVTLNSAKQLGNNTSVPLTIDALATLSTNNQGLTLHGDFINNGSLAAGTSNITITGTTATQNIGGFTTGGTVAMTKASGTATFTGNVTGVGLTIGTGTSTGTLNLGTGLTHTFSGTWSRIAGTLDGGISILNLTAPGAVVSVSGSGGTFTPNLGTVNYAGAAQSLGLLTYNKLILSGTGIKSLPGGTGGVTVNDTLSIENGTYTNNFIGILTFGTNATLQYNAGVNNRTVVSGEWPTPFTALGGVVIKGTGTITLNGAKQLGNNTSVPLKIMSGAKLVTAGNAITFDGDFINNNATAWDAGTAPVNLGGTTATQNIGGFKTTGLVSMIKTGGTAIFTGNVGGAGFTLNGSGGTLDLGAGLTHTFSGSWTRTTGALLGNSSTLVIGGTTTNTGGTFTPGTGTVQYNANGVQTIATILYNNLTLSGSGLKTFPAAIISNVVTIDTTAIADLGTYIHTTNTLNRYGVIKLSNLTGIYGGKYCSIAGATIDSVYFASSSATSTGALYVSTCIGPTWVGGATDNLPASLRDWNDPGNWNCGILPNATSDVILPAYKPGNYQPIISANAYCRSLTISTGDTLTMTGTPTLTVSGNWTNSGTFNAGSGTVIFNGPAQTVSGGTTFNNLTLSGTGIVTFGSQGFTSVNGIYLVGNGSNNNVYASNIQYGPNAGLQYFTSGTTPRVVNSAEWPGTFTGLGGVTINGTGAVSLNGAKIMGSNTAVNLTIASGATLITNSDNLTLNGSLFNPAGSGSSLGLQAGSSNITLTGTLASQSIDGFATAGLITMTKTGGTATFTGSVNGTSLIINGTGGTLNLGGSGLSHTFTGSWTSTSGTLDGGSATVYFTSTTAPFYSYTGGSFLPDNGTVNYSGAGAQTIAAVTYYNLVLSGSGAKSFPVNTTILSDLSINNATAGATADLGMALTHSAISLHLDGNSELAGYYGSPLSPAPPANQLPTYFGSTATGILNVGGACIPGNWTGEISSDWNTAGNWCSGTVPNSTTSVVIPILVNNNYPVISAADTCANITINAGASLTISGTNTLSVFGNWTSTGATFTPNSSEVVFSGGAQTLVGSPTFNSLTLAGSGTFTLNGSVTVNDTLSIENGTNSIVTGANGLLIYGPAATLQYNDGSASRTSGFEWPPIFVAAGGVVIKGSGTITMNNALQIGDLTHSAPLNILT